MAHLMRHLGRDIVVSLSDGERRVFCLSTEYADMPRLDLIVFEHQMNKMKTEKEKSMGQAAFVTDDKRKGRKVICDASDLNDDCCQRQKQLSAL